MQEEIFRLPTCGWPEDTEEKVIGTWMEEMLNSGIDGILRAYQLRVAGLTMEQHQVCNPPPFFFFFLFSCTCGLSPYVLPTESARNPLSCARDFPHLYTIDWNISDGLSNHRQLSYQSEET